MDALREAIPPTRKNIQLFFGLSFPTFIKRCTVLKRFLHTKTGEKRRLLEVSSASTSEAIPREYCLVLFVMSSTRWRVRLTLTGTTCKHLLQTSNLPLICQKHLLELNNLKFRALRCQFRQLSIFL